MAETPEDEDERFLKEFSLSRVWKRGEDDGLDADALAADDAALDAADQFEAKYNFRFEEEGGGQIVGHSRTIEGSIRKVDDKRKRQREAR